MKQAIVELRAAIEHYREVATPTAYSNVVCGALADMAEAMVVLGEQIAEASFPAQRKTIEDIVYKIELKAALRAALRSIETQC